MKPDASVGIIGLGLMAAPQSATYSRVMDTGVIEAIRQQPASSRVLR
jgi:hypothetical protein